MARHPISNGDDVIDSRDVIARIAELESDCTTCAECGEQFFTTESGINHHGDDEDSIDHDADANHVAIADEENLAEWQALRKLADDAAGYCPDWHHGATLIRDSYFETYAQDLAEDMHSRDAVRSWPFNCIDWGAAAEALQQDYASVDYDGVIYWVR